MIKVDNNRVIKDLSAMSYSANIKRNILTIAAIFLTTFLISTVLSTGICYKNTVDLRQQRMEGMDYDISLTEPHADQVKIIRELDSVKYAGISVKCAVLSSYKTKALDKVRLFWLDDTCWKKQTIPALEYYEGKYPEREDEIMLSQSALDSMGIKEPEKGMELPLIYDTLAYDGKYDLKKNFVLSGWFLDYTGSDKGFVSKEFYKSTGVRQTDLTQGELKISLTDNLYSEKDISEIRDSIQIYDKQIIMADYDIIKSFLRTAAALSVLLLLIFGSGYLFIYNTLYISINRDIRFYGQLKTLGTTSRQIKKMLFFQMAKNSIAGISLGLICSAAVGKLVIPYIINGLNPSIEATDVETVSLWTFVAAALFAFAATFISSFKPVKIAMNCSPVEAAGYIGNISCKSKNKVRNGGDIPSMVRMNILRDTKQFMVIMSSLSLALALFLVLNTMIEANNAAHILNDTSDCDIRILNQTILSEDERQVITPDLIEKIEKAKGVKNVRVLKSAEATVPYQENVYGDFYKELYDSRFSPGNYKDDMKEYKDNPEDSSFTCRIVGIDDSEFEKINSSLDEPVDEEKFENGEIAFASTIFTDNYDSMIGKEVRFSLHSHNNSEIEKTVQISAFVDYPAYYAAGYNPDLIISEDAFDSLVKQPLVEMIKVDYDKAFDKDAEKLVKSFMEDNKFLSYESKLDRYTEMKSTENQVRALGTSLGLIVMALALLNFINMMSSSIQNRSKEFAILESVGMTMKQLRQMVVAEGLCYGFMSIVLSLIIGLPLSYLAFENLKIYDISFKFPVINSFILYAGVIMVCAVSSILLFKNSRHESIIELLRKGEV